MIANLLILHNVRDMTKVFNDLTEEGFEFDQDWVSDFAPYRTGHINRFGIHTLDLDQNIQPLDEEKDFKLKVKTKKTFRNPLSNKDLPKDV